MLQTIGDVVTCGLALAAVLLVPAAIIRAWFPEIRARVMGAIMSRRAAPIVAGSADMNAVYRPVDQTSMDSGMEAGEWQMPRISAYLTDDEFIVMLARQKLRNGKYRLSANKIVDAVGGDRNKVLDVVRQVRQSPEYPSATPEQAAQREALELASH